MKKIFIIAIFYLSAVSVFAQKHFNKFYHSQSDVTIGSSVICLNDGSYICSSQYRTSNDNKEFIIKIAANGDTIWQKKYEGDFNVKYFGYSIIACKDGFVIGGTLSDNNSNNYDLYLHKYDNNGNSKWLQRYNTDSSDIAYKAIGTPDLGFILVGQTTSKASNGIADAYVVKTDSLGNKQWEGLYGGSGVEIAQGIDNTTDKGFVISGATTSYSNNNSYDHYVVKIDSLGKQQWAKHFGTPYEDNGGSITTLKDKNYIYASASPNANGTYFAKLVKLNRQGSVIWEKDYYLSDLTTFNTTVIENEDGSIVAGLGYSPTPSSKPLPFLMKVDYFGDTIWTRKYPYNQQTGDYFYDIKKTKDNGFIVCGSTVDTVAPNNQYAWLIKTDCNGNDSVHYAANNNCLQYFPPPVTINDTVSTVQNVPVTIHVLSNDFSYRGIDTTSIIIQSYPAHGKALLNNDDRIDYVPDSSFTGIDNIGYALTDIGGVSSNLSYIKIFVNKVVGINELDNVNKSLSIYPNPISDIATIHYQFHSSENVNLRVFNTQGIQVQSVLLKPNQNVLSLDCTDLANGVYFYGIDGVSEKRKMIVLH